MSIDNRLRNGRFIYVGLVVFSVLLPALSGCSGMKTATESPEKTVDKSKKPASYLPSWYKQDSRGFADSARFHGQGMAAASDSAGGLLKAEEVARRHLEQVIGDTLEKLRRQTEGQADNSLSDASFLIKLRNAVDGIGARAVMENKVSVEKEGRWIGFAQVSIKRSRVKEWLRKQLAEYPGFIESW